MEKKTTKKNLFTKLVALASVLILSVTMHAVTFNQTSAADEQTLDTTPVTPVASTAFAMEETASIRVSSETPGMRFYVDIGADVVETVKNADEFGFLIFPQVYLTYNGGSEVWHTKYVDDATAYGLYDYVEVKATKAEGAEAIANTIYEYNGGYRANGVLHTVTDKTMEFAAIAFYKVGETYTYATFEKDFSRSLQYVAQQAYIKQAELRTSLTSTFTWLASSTFAITSGADMTRLSNAVAAGASFEGINFELARTIAVGSDYVAVPENFAGTWDWNNYALLVVDNTVGRGFVSDEYNKEASFSWMNRRNGVVNTSSILIDAETAKFWNGSAYVGFNTDSVAIDANVTDATSKDDYVDYTKKAAAMELQHTASGKIFTNHYLSVSTNGWALPVPRKDKTQSEFCAQELNAVKELYSSVKFRFYVSYDSSGCLYGSSTGGITQSMGFINNKSLYSEGYWFEWTMSIDALIDCCADRGHTINESGNVIMNGAYGNNASNWYEGQTQTAFNGAHILPLGRLTLNLGSADRVGDSMMFYVGDCVFVK